MHILNRGTLGEASTLSEAADLTAGLGLAQD